MFAESFHAFFATRIKNYDYYYYYYQECSPSFKLLIWVVRHYHLSVSMMISFLFTSHTCTTSLGSLHLILCSPLNILCRQLLFSDLAEVIDSLKNCQTIMLTKLTKTDNPINWNTEHFSGIPFPVFQDYILSVPPVNKR